MQLNKIQIPLALRKELPGISAEVQILGLGSNAVVVRDLKTGNAWKLYGHNELLENAHIDMRISRHFASELLALTSLTCVHGAPVPTLLGHGRFHPSVQIGSGWLIRNVFAWMSMSYIKGERRDQPSIDAGMTFGPSEHNNQFYFSVGRILGQLHKSALGIPLSDIEHNIYEGQLSRAHLFGDFMRSKYEVTEPRFIDTKLAALGKDLKELQESHLEMDQLKSAFTFVHGDFAARNLIYKRDGHQIRASAVVDFGETGICVPEYDFSPMQLGEQPAAVDGYQSVGMKFSKERYDLVRRHDAVIWRMTQGQTTSTKFQIY